MKRCDPILGAKATHHHAAAYEYVRTRKIEILGGNQPKLLSQEVPHTKKTRNTFIRSPDQNHCLVVPAIVYFNPARRPPKCL